jgi:hypothetical protein
MKFIHRFIAVSALLFALAATSFAQSARRTVIEIPFDFVVGQKTLPAGRYRVEPLRRDSYTTWEIRAAKGRAGAVVNTTALRGSESESQPRLVFEQHGGTYVLAELWPSGDAEGRELAQSSRGRAADAEVAASRARKVEKVTLAINPN